MGDHNISLGRERFFVRAGC